MSQSKKMSLLEALINVAMGFGVAMAAQMIIFPIFGIYIPASSHFLIGGFFTVVSVARSYLLRRLFNWLHSRGNAQVDK